MRTTVDLDPDLVQRLRAEAHAEGVSFRVLLNRVVQRGLESGRPRRERYTCPVFALGDAMPGVDLDRARRIAADLEDAEVAREMALRK
jgi:hypothetical protein